VRPQHLVPPAGTNLPAPRQQEPAMTDQPSATGPELLAQLYGTVQALANLREEEPVLVDNVVIAWEQVRCTPNGDVGRRVDFAIPGDRFTVSGSIGLLDLIADRMRRQINETVPDTDD
jgi:hypothetical protein